MSQLTLFPALSPVSTLPIVSAPHPCGCGCTRAVLESSRGPHAGELRCADCGKHLMWANHALVADIRGSGFVTGTSSYQPGCRP
jgi:hypothetical protein